MLVDVALAARIDRAELRLISAIAGAVRAAEPALGVELRALAGGGAVLVRPGSPMNKLAALGFAGPLDLDELAAIEARWRDRGEPVRVELASLAAPEFAEQLGARGYRFRGFEHVLCRPLTARDAGQPTPEITIAEDDAAWCDTLLEGIAAPDGTGVTIDVVGQEALAAVMHDFAAAPGFRRYVARLAGERAGAASMRIDDGIALMCGASTLPGMRRRGVQTALLATRLRDAARAGCELAVVTTEPGSRSQHNVVRRGFELGYARAILALG